MEETGLIDAAVVSVTRDVSFKDIGADATLSAEADESGLRGDRVKDDEFVSIGAFLVSINGIFEGTEEDDKDCAAGTFILSVTASTIVIGIGTGIDVGIDFRV